MNKEVWDFNLFVLVVFFSGNLCLKSKGCPTGWTPAYDASTRTTISCTLATDCEPGAQCRWSPYSTELMCCRYFPGMAQGAPPGMPTPPWYVAPAKQLQEPEFPTPPPLPSQQPPGDGTPSEPSGQSTSGSLTVSPPPVYPPTAPSPQPQVATGPAPESVLPPGPILATPLVSPIIVGNWVQTGDPNVVRRTGSVTLISDNGYNIVVDTGLTCNTQDVVNGLAARGLHPNMVQMVVLTHGHPDHFGNVALFPSAQFVYWEYFYKLDEFMRFGLNEANNVRLTDNAELWKTPGHTPESVALVTRNVPNMGVVAVTGDLFISEDDILTPSLWQTVAWDINIQQQSRNIIICMAEWIIPGHSRMFAVTNSMKQSAGCSVPQTLAQVQPSTPAVPETTPPERVLQEARSPAPTEFPSPPPSVPTPTAAPVYASVIGTPLPSVVYATYLYNQSSNNATLYKDPVQPVVYGQYLYNNQNGQTSNARQATTGLKPPVYGPPAYYLSQVGQPMTLVKYNGRYYSYAVPPRYMRIISRRKKPVSRGSR